MKINKNYSLKKLNAFHVDVFAKCFVKIENTSELKKILSDPKLKKEKKYILGESSGTLFKDDFDGLVLRVALKGKRVIKETEKTVFVEACAGEIWHDFVLWAIKKGYSGIENLSLIPGTVGAAPVHNIAAYGQNFEDVFFSLEAINLKTGKERVFSKDDCKFGYRESVFKNKLKGKYIITKIVLKLAKLKHLNTSYHSRYESLEDELNNIAKKPYSLSDISKAVINIRSRKFPDWKKTGNSGSFFKNPIVSAKKLRDIQINYPKIQFYPADKLIYSKSINNDSKKPKRVKIAAGWLLEELGWKGKRIGSVGTSPNQALVIVNYGGATAKEILDFAEKMNKDFQKQFGVKLEPEVNIV